MRFYDISLIILTNNQCCDVQGKPIQAALPQNFNCWASCIKDFLIKLNIELITVHARNMLVYNAKPRTSSLSTAPLLA